MTALAGWENFYVIVGSSAGALMLCGGLVAIGAPAGAAPNRQPTFGSYITVLPTTMFSSGLAGDAGSG